MLIILDGVNGKIADEVQSGGNRWVRIGVAPGQYSVALKATVAGDPVATSTAILVKSGEIVKAETSLPS